MWPEPYTSRPRAAVSSREACELAGIHRVTLWKWIYEDGLRYWRDPEHPHGYYYAPTDLRRMKRARGARKIARQKPPPNAYDYD